MHINEIAMHKWIILHEPTIAPRHQIRDCMIISPIAWSNSLSPDHDPYCLTMHLLLLIIMHTFQDHASYISWSGRTAIRSCILPIWSCLLSYMIMHFVLWSGNCITRSGMIATFECIVRWLLLLIAVTFNMGLDLAWSGKTRHDRSWSR